MKRIEMIEIIAEWLKTQAPETYENRDRLIIEHDAESLLSLIEEKGMLPPSVPTFTINDVVLREKNEWETDLETEIKNDIL